MMIESQYSSVITSTGHAANIQAKALEIPIVFGDIAFGSGGLIPNESATGLVKEEVRVKVNSVLQNQTDANVLEIEAVIPANTGGFTINEAAIYLDDGTLYAVASLPESYKPNLEQGAGKEFLFVFFLTSVGAENVTLTIDGGASFITINFFQNELKKYALINGDETEKFKVADAQNDNEAINKKQLNALESRLKSSSNRNITTSTKVVGAGYMGEFGQGLWNAFYQNGTFTVPNDVDKIRVRVVGAGGGGKGGVNTGGGGGGYAHGVFDVIAGETYTVTVGTGGYGAYSNGTAIAGGTSSFGSLISATGGAGGNSIAVGGDGIGGDFQAKGGKATSRGGAGAGSQLGKGGDSYSDAGAGICSGHSLSGRGSGSAFGSSLTLNGAPSISGFIATPTTVDLIQKENPIGATIRFPFDCFTGGGGFSSNSSGDGNEAKNGSSGAGGGTISAIGGGVGGAGGVGGGGGCGTVTGGNGGIGGGGGGSLNASGGGKAGDGGSGIVVVEW